MMPLKPYQEMNPLEVVMYWTRLKAKAPDGFSIFKSPNGVLWAVVDEVRGETIGMWDVNSGHVYQSHEVKVAPDVALISCTKGDER